MGNGQFNYKLLEELWYATVHYNIDYIAHQTTHAYMQIHTMSLPSTNYQSDIDPLYQFPTSGPSVATYFSTIPQ